MDVFSQNPTERVNKSDGANSNSILGEIRLIRPITEGDSGTTLKEVSWALRGKRINALIKMRISLFITLKLKFLSADFTIAGILVV